MIITLLHLISGMRECKMKTKYSALKEMTMAKIEKIERTEFSRERIKQIMEDNEHKATEKAVGSIHVGIDAKTRISFRGIVVPDIYIFLFFFIPL